MDSWKVKTIYFETIDSTQKYLIEQIKSNSLKPPVCVWSENQTAGVGSRGNSWQNQKGNLFFSFAITPPSFPIQSVSIYYAFIIKEVLNSYGADIIIKWPNDLYDKKSLKKVGGVMSSVLKEAVVVGIGVNTKKSPKKEFGGLDIGIKNDKILQRFFQTDMAFEEVIKRYKQEFEKTKALFGLSGSIAKDGALVQNNKRIYSRR
ncbi:MAG: biotin--[acetyl-CoA-carboxylase] ligase [Epsilonproteobacteria bacterium]|nr:biotin--[acetyl-CoA-carboxylase] ligase [Campylobacterota bacterium]